MIKLLEDSKIIKLLNKIFLFFKKIVANSFIGNFFLRSSIDVNQYIKSSFLYGLCRKSILFIKKLIYKLKLDDYLKNSIFTNSLFFAILNIFCLPFSKTIFIGIISAISCVSLILNYCVNDIKIKKLSLNYLIILFVICILFQSVFSYKNFSTLKILVLYFFIISNYFVVINSIESVNDLKKIINSFLCSGFLVSIYGIYQYIFNKVGLVESWIDTDMFKNISSRVVSTFNNPNILGEYLIVIVTLSFGMIFANKSLKAKIFPMISFLASFLCMIFTYSRGCWIGVLLALVLMVVILDKRYILVGIILMLGALLIMPDSIMQRLLSIGNIKDSSTFFRVGIWHQSFIMLKQFLISGIGFGSENFKYVFAYFSNAVYVVEHPHNLFLYLALSLGIVGLVVFVILLLFYFKEVISNYVKYRKSKLEVDKYKRITLLSFFCSFIGLLVQGMFDNIWYNYAIILLFFLLIAISISITKLDGDQL